MKTILDTPFGYMTYDINALWNGLSQMGWVGENTGVLS